MSRIKLNKIVSTFLLIVFFISCIPSISLGATENDKQDYDNSMYKGELNIDGKSKTNFTRDDKSDINIENPLLISEGNTLGLKASFDLDNINEIIDRVSEGEIEGIPRMFGQFIGMFSGQALISGSFDLKIDLSDEFSKYFSINEDKLNEIKENPNVLISSNPSYEEVFKVNSVTSSNNTISISISLKEGVTGSKILNLKNKFKTLDANLFGIFEIDKDFWNEINKDKIAKLNKIITISTPDTVFIVSIPDYLIKLAESYGLTGLKNPFLGVVLNMEESYGALNIGYMINFESNGGTLIESQKVTYGEKVKKPIDPTKPNYGFGGWYTDEALITAYDFENPVTEDMTLYAKWDLNKQTVIFEPNGGTFADGTTEAKQVSVNHGEKVKEEEISKTGSKFEGWYTDKELTKIYDFESPVTEDITLYAKWDVNKYTVIFEPNGGTFKDGTTEAKQVSVNHGEKVTSEVITKENNGFGGWYKDKELTKKYDFNAEVTEDITLYAKWRLDKRTVTFEPNGGTFKDGTTEAKQVSVNHGEKVKEEEITKKDSTFEGWFTDKELTKAYDFENPVTEDITLYAKWKANDPVAIKGVTLIGGTAALSQRVENQLKEYNPKRLQGADRYTTAVKVSREY
ncbi:InlB B-repeat-containing protein, partial [Miniphocaeibacter massiliensis]|uniref:InlB B-repeat-containing protein n=1 Tax=Miniphocaeibacter massiliensis TaxID=2041841 RepID=UPI001A933D68